MSEPLDAARLQELLQRIPCIGHIAVCERTGSTNDDARRLAAAGAPAWTVVVAGAQDAGRGRLGRTWYSAEGLGLYITVLLRPRARASEAARFTLAAAAAGAEACAAVGAGAITIKWPNDVLASGRKIAGVLAELRSGADDVHELIVGVGFNVHHAAEDFPAPLDRTATSLRMAGAPFGIRREDLAFAWLQRFAALAEALDRGEWESVANRWHAFAPGAQGSPVRVVSADSGGAARTGVTRGLDPTGALRVETPDGETIIVRSTDSVVPLEA